MRLLIHLVKGVPGLSAEARIWDSEVEEKPASAGNQQVLEPISHSIYEPMTEI